MRKFKFLFSLLLLVVFGFSCSMTDSNMELLTKPGEGFSLEKSAPDLVKGKIVALTPAESAVRFEVMRETESEIITKISGVRDFILQSALDSEVRYFVTGEIRYMLVEQDVNSDGIGLARLAAIEGNIGYKVVFGDSPEEWFSRSLSDAKNGKN